MSAGTRIFECVPNVSEGRNVRTIEQCVHAIESADVTLADHSSDAAHHRSVFTFFGDAAGVHDAALALATIATQRIDLRTHAGAHPRIGALDVLPIVPFASATIGHAVELAHAIATHIWERCGVPSYFYGAAVTTQARRALPAVRAGQFEGLLAQPHRSGPPDVGDIAVHPRAGAIAVGVRGPLVAYNVVLESDDAGLARRIARTLRERDGGVPTLRALAIALEDGRMQISCNLTDPAALDPGLVYDMVESLARAGGVDVAGSELIGLIPRAALERVVARAFGISTIDFTSAGGAAAEGPSRASQ